MAAALTRNFQFDLREGLLVVEIPRMRRNRASALGALPHATISASMSPNPREDRPSASEANQAGVGRAQVALFVV